MPRNGTLSDCWDAHLRGHLGWANGLAARHGYDSLRADYLGLGATGEATALVLVGVFATVPSLFATFVAGPLVDRWNRKHMMIVSDLCAGLATLALFVLYMSGGLQVWHLYLASAVSSIARTFQHLAYSAASPRSSPKRSTPAPAA